MQSWPAPRADRPVHASVTLPGSKSLTNRLLLLAALAEGPSRLIAPLRARDTLLMVGALQALGAHVADDGDDLAISPSGLHGCSIDTGLAGTVMRFVPPIAVLADGPVTFDGDVYARTRPMASMLDALQGLGARITSDGGRMPFTVDGAGSFRGGAVEVDGSASSQFVSGLLLAGARYPDGLELRHSGASRVPSQPHVDMTIQVLRDAGVDAAECAPGHWLVRPGPISAGVHRIEPDLSNAAPFLAAAMVTGGSVLVPHWPASTTQPGDQLRTLLAAMGAEVSLDARGLTVSGTGTIRGLDADLRDVSELATIIAALAALADTPSQLSGLGHMRGHETDRLAALHHELTGLGAVVTEHPDALTIEPSTLHGGAWHSYADHRMATAGAVVGLAVDGVEIDDIGATTKTLPDFPGMWSAMLAG